MYLCLALVEVDAFGLYNCFLICLNKWLGLGLLFSFGLAICLMALVIADGLNLLFKQIFRLAAGLTSFGKEAKL